MREERVRERESEGAERQERLKLGVGENLSELFILYRREKNRKI